MRGRGTTGSGEVAGAAGRGEWREAAEALDGWMRGRDYRGHDPYDALASPLIRRLSLGRRYPAIVWTQLGKRSPIGLRRWLGVPAARNAKGIALVLAARVRLARAGGGEREREQARALAVWLLEQTAPGYPGAGWGYPFPWANRDFHAPAGTPSSVVTAFVGHALLDAAEAFDWPDVAAAASRAGDFLREALNRIPGPGGTFCFSYTPLDRRGVHNASLLAASLLARLGRLEGRAELVGEALRAARFTIAAQRPDGSWPYGIGARNAWVDSFHTGYTLVALAEVGEASGGASGGADLDAAIERGLAYWRRAFLVGPAVGYFPGRAFPIDMHAVAHAILTLLAFRDRLPDAVPVAERLGDWALREMRHDEGYFYYRMLHGRRDRTVYMRWVQAWMLRALAELAAAEAAWPIAERRGEQAGSETKAGTES